MDWWMVGWACGTLTTAGIVRFPARCFCLKRSGTRSCRIRSISGAAFRHGPREASASGSRMRTDRRGCLPLAQISGWLMGAARNQTFFLTGGVALTMLAVNETCCYEQSIDVVHWRG